MKNVVLSTVAMVLFSLPAVAGKNFSEIVGGLAVTYADGGAGSHCVQQQVGSFEYQFRHNLNLSARRAFPQQVVNQYRSIHFNPTVTTQTLTGQQAVLTLVKTVCSPGGGSPNGPGPSVCRVVTLSSKKILDNTASSGSAPQSVVAANAGVLNITVQQVSDRTSQKNFKTSSRSVYDQVVAYQDAAFNRALKNASILLENEKTSPTIECADEIEISRLLNP